MSMNNTVRAILAEVLHDGMGEGDINALAKQVCEAVRAYQKPTPVSTTTITHKVGETSKTETTHLYDRPEAMHNIKIDVSGGIDAEAVAERVREQLHVNSEQYREALKPKLDFETYSRVPLVDGLGEELRKIGNGAWAEYVDGLVHIHPPGTPKSGMWAWASLDGGWNGQAPVPVKSIIYRQYKGRWDKFLCWIGVRSNMVAFIDLESGL